MWKTFGQAIAQSVDTVRNDQWRAYERAADLLEISHRNKLDILIQTERF
jgi:hypothetical protein